MEHLGARLWICTFDGGTITPNEEEISAGWSVVDEALVSPPMSIDLDVPCDQYDEWYIFPDAHSRLQDFERFVNFGGFTLADPSSMAESLYPVQERFWKQIERLRPISYVATGDNEVIVTRNPSFAAKLRETMK